MRRHTDSGGVRIAFEDTGDGGPAIVLIHGAFGSGRHYAAVTEHLSRRHRVLVPDLRSHGDSEAAPEPFGIRQAAQDVVAVCDAAGIEQAVVCGHSWPVALHVAAARPHLVAGVALLDGAVLFPEEVRAQILAEVVPLLEGPAWADVLRGFFSSRAFDAHESAELRARILDELGRAPSYLPACVMRDVMASDHADLLAGDWPLLYVHAGIPTDLARLRELRPDALIGSVAGGGHWMMLSVPEQVNAMLDTFLDVVAARVSEVAATV